MGDGDSGDGDAGGDGDTGSITIPTSPSNPWIAFTKIDGANFGQLYFIKADGTDVHEYGGSSSSESAPAWSNDGMKLAFVASGGIQILDFDAGTESTLDLGDLAGAQRPRWTADDETIIVSGVENPGDVFSLWAIDVSGDDDPREISSSVNGDGGHDVALDGTIYFVRNDGGFDVFETSVGASPGDETRVTDGADVIGGVNTNPDGSKVLFAADANMTTDLTEVVVDGGASTVIGMKGD
jgi:Tol biopolymer transport system component